MGRSFWQVAIPQQCSWSWKKLLHLRDISKYFFLFKVGDACAIFLWVDNWHLAGYLLDKYGHRSVYDAGHSRERMVLATS
jgi:hypothetical protein